MTPRQKIRNYILERTGIPLTEECDPVDWLIASHYQLGEMNLHAEMMKREYAEEKFKP